MTEPVNHIELDDEHPVGTARKFTTDVVVRALFQVLNAFKGLLYLPLISKQFGAEGYGIWSQIIITVTLFSPVLTLRLGDAIVRYFGSVKDLGERGRSFFSAAVVVWLISAAVSFGGLLASRPIALIMFGDSSLHPYVILFLGLLVVRVNLGFTLSYYRSMSAIRLYSAFQAIEILANLTALALLTLFFHKGLVEVLGAFIAIDFSLILGLLGNITRREGISLSPDYTVLKKYLRYSLPLVPTVALYWIINSGDRYVIVHYLGLEQVGIYSAAYRLGQVLKLLVQPISFVLLPLVSRMWEAGQRDQVRRYMAQSLKYYVLLAAPASAGLIILGPSLLRFLGTGAFFVSQGLIAALVVGIFFVGLYQIYVYILYLQEKTKLLPLIFLLVATLNLGLNILLVPVIGILGAAFTTCLSYFVQFAVVYCYTRRFFKVPFQISFVLKAMASSAAMYGLLTLLPNGMWIEWGIIVAVGIVVYFTMMTLLKGIRREDLHRVLRLFAKGSKS